MDRLQDSLNSPDSRCLPLRLQEHGSFIYQDIIRQNPFYEILGEILSIFTNQNCMPSPLAPRTPGYRLKDGKLMIFHEDEVMLIQGGNPPSVLRRMTCEGFREVCRRASR
jgi:hypothetical protein